MLLGEGIQGFSFLIPWIFGFVTFTGGLKMNVRSFAKTVAKPKPILGVLFILRVLMPLWALLYGHLVFPTDPYVRTGLLLFGLIPVGINSVVWTTMVNGSVEQSLSVVIIDTLLSPIMLPVSILLLTGTQVEMDTLGMVVSLLTMIVIPSVLGMCVNQATKGAFPKKWNAKLAPWAKIAIMVTLIINGSNVGEHFTTIDGRLLFIMSSLAVLSITGYLIAWQVAKWLKLEVAELKAFVFSGGMRNTNTGIVIAVAHFPPAVALPIATGVFFQQLVCATFAKVLMHKFSKTDHTQPKLAKAS